MLTKPMKDTENNKELWKLDLVLVDENGASYEFKDKIGNKVKSLDRAKAAGLIVKDASNSIPGQYIKIKREKKTRVDPETKETKVTQQPKVSMSNGTDLNGKLVGNGSLVSVRFTAIPISKNPAYKGKSSAYLNSVTVYSLVEYVKAMQEDNIEFSDEYIKDAQKTDAVDSNKKVVVDGDDVIELED